MQEEADKMRPSDIFVEFICNAVWPDTENRLGPKPESGMNKACGIFGLLWVDAN